MHIKVSKRSESAICAIIIAVLSVYFMSNFVVVTSISDFFYDADTPRTLNYLNYPNTSFSSLRPLLVVIASAGYLVNVFFSTYFSWCVLNFMSIVGLGWSLGKLTRKYFSYTQIALLLTANFSVLCWFAVPETFLLSISFFSISIVVYGEGRQFSRIVMSGIIASCLNIFLLFPWLAAHFIIGRKFLRETLITASLVTLPISIAAVAGQFFTQYRISTTLTSLTSDAASETFQSTFPLYGSDGALAGISALYWFHLPWKDFRYNAIAYLTAPWIPGYKYEIGNIPRDSQMFPAILLILATALTLIAFYGLALSRHKNSKIFVFCISLEVAVFLLFITYSAHPTLFSPFLILPRLFGILTLSHGRKTSFYLMVGVCASFMVISLQVLNYGSS